MKLAAIDIGSKSIHLVVVRAVKGQHPEIIDREKEMVRLGAGSLREHLLSKEKIERAVTTEMSGARVTFHVECAGACDLEMWSAERKAELVQRSLPNLDSIRAGASNAGPTNRQDRRRPGPRLTITKTSSNRFDAVGSRQNLPLGISLHSAHLNLCQRYAYVLTQNG